MNLADVLKKDWPIWLVILAPFVAIPIVWDQLPNEIPIHWNFSGEADRYAPKLIGLILLPGLSVVLYLMYGLLPKIDPKRQIDMQQKPVAALRKLMPVFMTVIFFFALNKQLNPEADISGGVLLVVSVLFMALGNYMNTIQPNYFIGIRTPWTLQDNEVWRKTHRLGARVWVLGGATLVLCWIVYDLATLRNLFFPILLVMVISPVVYSYMAFRDLDQAGEEQV